jgi:hypothetical protein
MIDYEGRTDTLSAFPETVPVSVLEYRTLVEDAEKGRVMADGILSAVTYDGVTRYGREISLSADTVLAVFRAVYPDDYDLWMKEEKRRVEEARKGAAENDPV